MNHSRIRITKLAVIDGDLPPAEVSFASGLNLIIGASDTGKTFIFEAIDFMLGAKDLRQIPESNGYTRVMLSIAPSDAPSVTLRRAFNGGGIEVIDNPHSGTLGPPSRILSAVHSPDPNSSLSGYLLDLIGLNGRRVRKSAQGEKQALSFRGVSHLTLVGEERIIRQGSPILSGYGDTADKSIFAYFITGTDDSSIISDEKPQVRKTRLETEENLLESILMDKRAELAERRTINESDLADQENRLESAIREATESLVASQNEISALERRRLLLTGLRAENESRLQFLEEQLKRLRLLDDYYKTDRERLKTVLQASDAFHELPEGTCPLCKRPYSDDFNEIPSHLEFKRACLEEINKIDALSKDLRATIGDFSYEEAAKRDVLINLSNEVAEMEATLKTLLIPAARSSQEDIQGLVRTRTAVAQSTLLFGDICSLEGRLEQVRIERKKRKPRNRFEDRASTSVTTEFCQVVEEILRAWKYPDLGTVTFDTKKADLVIGGQDRANKGKGYRALTYAAFVVGLMQYCRRKNIPHPGFVVLDSPVNPFKGPAFTSPTEMLPDEMKVAFFDYLARDTSGDQIIVMDNEDPPEHVRNRVTYYHFTKNYDLGRYGFFPSKR